MPVHDALDAAWDRRRPPAAVRLVASAVFSLVVQLPPAAWFVALGVFSAAPWFGALHVALAIAGPAALLAARRWPGPTVAVVSAFALTDVLVGPPVGPPYLALAFAIIGAVVRGAAVWAAASVATAWAAAVLTGSLSGRDWHVPQIVFATIALAFCFAIGWFVRTRRARFQAARDAAARRRQSAEERERVRIARELHDVLGHALSQINVQASVGLHLFDRDPEQARVALGNVKETSKTALDEVRSVLGVLREGEAPLVPEAELAELPRLIAGARSPGFAVDLDDRLAGQAPSRAAQFAAYRIVQEALTNVVRHADASRAIVRLERAAETLVVTVEDDGAGFDAGRAPTHAAAPDLGRGSGLIGMQERAALLGGTVDFAGSPLGGARVVARLPWGRAA